MSQTSSTSPQPSEATVVSNTTPLRYFALTDNIDLLAQLLGGRIRVPREVLDPEEDLTLPEELLSDIGRTERFFQHRARDPEAEDDQAKLHALRLRQDIDVVDLIEDEIATYAELKSGAFQRAAGLVAKLGNGECAVIAIAKHRGWSVAMDDRAAIKALKSVNPNTQVWSSTRLLKFAVWNVFDGDTNKANEIYARMRQKHYRGPDSIWLDDR